MSLPILTPLLPSALHRVAGAVLTCLCLSAAQAAPQPAGDAPQHTVHKPARQAHSQSTTPPMEADMRAVVQRSVSMYDVLAGELFAQNKQALNKSYAHFMNAARRSADVRLYARAADVAMRGHAPDAALHAVAAWKALAPDDANASMAELQIRALLSQPQKMQAPLRQVLRHTTPDKRNPLIHSLPALFAKFSLQEDVLHMVQAELAPYQQAAETAFVSDVTLARMYLAAGKLSPAMDWLERSQTATVPEGKLGAILPGSELPAIVALDVLRLAAGKNDTALAARAQALISHHSQKAQASEEMQLGHAQTLLDLQRPRDARVVLKKLLRQYPNSPLPRVLQAAVDMDAKHYNDANTHLQKYLQLRQQEEQTPDDTDPTGASNGDSDNQQQASRLLKRITSEHGDALVYIMLAEVADVRQQPHQAVQWLQRIHPDTARHAAMLRRAETLSSKGRYADARHMAEHLPASTPQEHSIKALLASRIDEQTGDIGRAVDTLTHALRTDPDNVELLYARGILLGQQNQHTQAEQDLRRVIALQPDSPAAYNALGYALADRGQQLDEALALITKALNMAPDNGAIIDSMGWVQYRLGQLPQALEHLEKAWSLDPQAEIAAHLGEVLWKSGDTDKARAIWRQGLHIDAKDTVLLETMRRFGVQP